MDIAPVPRGIEVLVKKAAVDAEFRKLLLTRRAGAADEIGLILEPTEAAMLNAVPAGQLESIIANTHVDPAVRHVFQGKALTPILVALGVGAVAAAVFLPSLGHSVSHGQRPGPPRAQSTTSAPANPATQPGPPLQAGIRSEPGSPPDSHSAPPKGPKHLPP